MTRNRWLALVGTAVLAAALLAAPRAAAVPAGLLLALVLPGIAATAALVPGRELTLVERLVLVPALSLALLVLGGLGLFACRVPLDRWSWGALTAGGTVLAATVAYVRHHRAGRESGSSLPWRPLARRMLPLALAAGLLGGAAWVSVASAHAQWSGTKVVALSMTAADEATTGTRTVLVSVRGTGGYALRLRGPEGYDSTLTVRVGPTGTWSRTLAVPTSGRVTALLYRPGDDTAYRVVYLDGAAPQAGT